MLRFALLLSVSALAVGCTGRTLPLSAGNGGGGTSSNVVDGGSNIVDAGFGADASVLDVGGGGPVDAGPGPGNFCGFGPFSLNMRISAEDFPSYDGTAVLLSRDPLDLQLFNGSVVRISLGAAPLPGDFEPGRLLWLQYGRDVPQWVNQAVALREIAPNDGPGRVRVVAWSFGEFEDFEFDIEDDLFDLQYEADECTPADLAGCGPARTASLIVESPNVETRVPAGQVQNYRTFEVGNGRSHGYDRFPNCTDTPSMWFEGYLTVY